MTKLVLPVFICMAVTATAQKADNIFIATELNKAMGFSFAYNRTIPKIHVGVGVAVELIDIGTRELGGIMPSLDARYYLKVRKSTFIPLAQVGYNFYEHQYTKFGTFNEYKTQGGGSLSLGVGYSYQANAKGGGPFAAIKYRSLQYKFNDPALPATNDINHLKFSFGWRF